jgi:hypothetical protein
VENAAELTNIFMAMGTFAKRFPALLAPQAERIHNLLILLKEREQDTIYQRMIEALLTVAQISLPLNEKTKETIQQLQAKLKDIMLYASSPAVGLAAACLAILTRKSGQAYFSFIHRLAREQFGKDGSSLRVLYSLGVLWQAFNFDKDLPLNAAEKVGISFISF